MGELHVRSDIQRQAEISYSVHPRVWGQGIGTQIGRQLLAFGFGELQHRTESLVVAATSPSCLLRRCCGRRSSPGCELAVCRAEAEVVRDADAIEAVRWR
ncbi:GNAT family N-acetyltransferase [Streptomyces sp. NPDC057245]|uniref:GNAT family N-acetyltransferase n=1 Tax=Streptomyces sp. NPDC057245 TaxID=3346065 RepID=UPI00362F7627